MDRLRGDTSQYALPKVKPLAKEQLSVPRSQSRPPIAARERPLFTFDPLHIGNDEVNSRGTKSGLAERAERHTNEHTQDKQKTKRHHAPAIPKLGSEPHHKPKTVLGRIGRQLASLASTLQDESTSTSTSSSDGEREAEAPAGSRRMGNTAASPNGSTRAPLTPLRGKPESAPSFDDEEDDNSDHPSDADPFAGIHFLGSPLVSIAMLPLWYKALSLGSAISFIYLNNSSVVSKVLHFLHFSFGTRMLWPDEYQAELVTLSLTDRCVLAVYAVMLLGCSLAILFLRRRWANKLDRVIGMCPTSREVDDDFLTRRLSALHGLTEKEIADFQEEETQGALLDPKPREALEQLAYWRRTLATALSRSVVEGIVHLQQGGGRGVNTSGMEELVNRKARSAPDAEKSNFPSVAAECATVAGLTELAFLVAGLRYPMVEQSVDVRSSARSQKKRVRAQSRLDGSNDSEREAQIATDEYGHLPTATSDKNWMLGSWVFYVAVAFDCVFWLRTLIQWAVFNVASPPNLDTTPYPIVSFLVHQQAFYPLLSRLLGSQMLFQLRGLLHALFLWWPLHIGVPLVLVSAHTLWKRVLTRSSLPATGTVRLHSQQYDDASRRRRNLPSFRTFIANYLFVRLAMEVVLYAIDYQLPAFVNPLTEAFGFADNSFQRAVAASPGGPIAKVLALCIANAVPWILVNYKYSTPLARVSPALHVLSYRILPVVDSDPHHTARRPSKRAHSNDMAMSLVGNALNHDSTTDEEDDDNTMGNSGNDFKNVDRRSPISRNKGASNKPISRLESEEVDFGDTFYLNPKESAFRRRVRDKSLIPFMLAIEARRLGLKVSLYVVLLWSLQLAAITILATLIPLALLVGVHVVELFLLWGLTTFAFLWIPATIDSFAVDCFFYLGVAATVFHQVFIDSIVTPAGWPPVVTGLLVMLVLTTVSTTFSFLSNLLRSRKRGLWATGVCTLLTVWLWAAMTREWQADAATTTRDVFIGFGFMGALAWCTMYLNDLLVRRRGGIAAFYAELYVVHYPLVGRSVVPNTFQSPIPVVATVDLLWRKLAVGMTKAGIVSFSLLTAWMIAGSMPIPTVDWMPALWAPKVPRGTEAPSTTGLYGTLSDIYSALSNSLVPVSTIRMILFVLLACVFMGVTKAHVPTVYIHTVRALGLLSHNRRAAGQHARKRGDKRATTRAVVASTATSSSTSSSTTRNKSRLPPDVKPSPSPTPNRQSVENSPQSKASREEGGAGTTSTPSTPSTQIQLRLPSAANSSANVAWGGGSHTSNTSSVEPSSNHRNSTHLLTTPSQGATARDTLSRLRQHKGFFN